MSAILGIVEVPARSLTAANRPQSIPRPAFLRIEGQLLVEWIIRRVTDSQLLDSVAVLVDPSQQNALRRATPTDVNLVVGSEPDALGNFAAAVRRFDASQVVRVRVDSPFVDPELIDRLICTANLHPSADYVGYRSQGETPRWQPKLGVFAEYCRAEAVLEAERIATSSADRQDSMQFLSSHAEHFEQKMIPIPPALDRDDVRLTVDVEEDWEHAQSIVEALGPDSLNWHAIAGLLNEQPAMRKRMAVLNQAEGSYL